MDDPIANLGLIKALASHFLELTAFYIAQWLPYHTALTNAAAKFVFPAGLVWFAFNAAKLPTDKGRTFLGGAALLAFIAVLLSASSRATAVLPGVTLPANVKMANGSVWSYGIGASVYKLFKSAIDSAAGSDQESRQVGLLVAYEMNTAKVGSMWADTPLEELYITYVNNCTRAVMNTATTDSDVKLMGHVGLLGGSGIGWKQSDLELLEAFQAGRSQASDEFYGKGSTVGDNFVADKILFGWVGRNVIAAGSGVGAAWEAWNVSDTVSEAKAKLKAIPPELDPFDDVSRKYPQGFMVPTEQFWRAKFNATATGDKYFNGATHDGGKYLQPELAQAPSSGNASKNHAFYPNTCEEAFEITNLAVAEYRKGWAANPELANRPAEYAETRALEDLALQNDAMLKRAEALRTNDEAQALNSQSQQSVQTGYQETIDETMDAIITMGEKIFEFLLQYKMPFFLSSMSMLLAGLITTLPIFITMSVFLGTKILISYVKLVAFAFTVVLINDAFLSMGADLIANTNRMQLVYTIGNIRDNGALEIASATVKVVVLISITVIEVIIAKMLIWDDVKGMSGFSPSGGAGASFLAAAGAIGAVMKFAAPAGRAVGAASKIASGSKAASGAMRYSGNAAGASSTSVIGTIRTAAAQAPQPQRGGRPGAGGSANLVPPRPTSPGPSASGPSGGGGGSPSGPAGGTS
ncbi:hypothetical protein SAMN05216178_7033 [Pseudomonas saponiphila]|uniref:TraG-like protein, N-terminal region n=1 Tax=Pseudomonas saponiphila TaxID=556534 RepID=A0A1H5A9V4_9PSED|nr:hypothetical protein [Pseudomonas saponiphila]SED38564.1 hypothetical protein SAMN05216178_7033 [Pseudomonas saponiphila]